MGQEQPRWRRPTKDDYEWPEKATEKEIQEALRAAPPIRTTAAPQQNMVEFGKQATKSFNPALWAEGVYDTVRHPVDAAVGLATAPGDMMEAAKGEWRQGNYGQAVAKGALSTLPLIGAGIGAAGSLPAGGTGAIPGYMTGTGLMAGLDQTMEDALEGNYYSAAGNAVDAAVQAFQGRGAIRTAARPATTPGQLGSDLERRVARKSEQLFAPVTGSHKVNYGNVAEDIGGRILRSTTGTNVDDITREITKRHTAALGSLDAAYARIPPGFRMKTDVVKQALEKEIRSKQTRNNNGMLETALGHEAYVAGLREALDRLNRVPGSIPADEVRVIRQGFDNIADFEPPATSTDWTKANMERRDAFRRARTFLNEQTKGTWPQLGPEMDNTHFSIQANELLQALHESERGRPKVGRSMMATGLGAMAGAVSGKGTAATVVGAMVAPAIVSLAEHVDPVVRIKAGRTMANMAHEIRTNGRTPLAISMAKQLQAMALTAGRAGRANERVNTDQAAQLPQDMVVSPEQAAAKGGLTNWFDSILQKTGGR